MCRNEETYRTDFDLSEEDGEFLERVSNIGAAQDLEAFLTQSWEPVGPMPKGEAYYNSHWRRQNGLHGLMAVSVKEVSNR